MHAYGFTVRVLVRDTVPVVAVIETTVFTETEVVFTVNTAELWPAVMVTEVGTTT